jgi:hypothetical protein
MTATVLLMVLGIAFLVGAGLMVAGVLTAPVLSEDGSLIELGGGVYCNNSPVVRDVSLVWACCARA